MLFTSKQVYVTINVIYQVSCSLYINVLSCAVQINSVSFYQLPYIISLMFQNLNYEFIEYRIAENIGGRKLWRIWRICRESPKFSCPKFSTKSFLLKIRLRFVVCGLRQDGVVTIF